MCLQERAGNGWVRAAGIRSADVAGTPSEKDARTSEFDDTESERSQHDSSLAAVCMQPDATLVLASPSPTGDSAAATAVEASWRASTGPTLRRRRSLAGQMQSSHWPAATA